MTVEAECVITSYVNDPTVSLTSETNYIINTVAVTFPFDIRYEPTTCNYIVSYSFTVNGVSASPTWLSVDTSTEPHQIKIDSSDASDTGVYTIGVSASTNATPKYVSTNSYIFVASLSYDSCSSISFDAQTLATINFEIADGAPASSSTFFTHSNSGGLFTCGPRQYSLVETYAGLAFEG